MPHHNLSYLKPASTSVTPPLTFFYHLRHRHHQLRLLGDLFLFPTSLPPPPPVVAANAFRVALPGAPSHIVLTPSPIMPPRLPLRPSLFTMAPLAAVPTHLRRAHADHSTSTPSSQQPSVPRPSHSRRADAARLLTLASTLEPVRTARALHAARVHILAQRLPASDRTFIMGVARDAAARGIACAAGGAAAAHLALRIVTVVLPIAAFPLLRAAAIAATAAAAALVELATLPDVTVVEIMLLGTEHGHHPDGIFINESNAGLGAWVWKAVEEYDNSLLLLDIVRRHRRALEAGVYTVADAQTASVSKRQQQQHVDMDLHLP